MGKLKSRSYTTWCWTGCALSTVFWATVSVLGSLVSGKGTLQHFCMRRWSKDNLWLSRAENRFLGGDRIALLEKIDQLGSIKPVEKTLLLNLDSLGIPLDNVEGMTFGPDLADGRRSLVLVSDNNFAPAQFTQFLLFAYSEK